MSSLNSHSVNEAIAWICRAQDHCTHNGVPAVFSLYSGWSDPYPETTGYIIPTFLELAKLLDRPELKERALKMGNWLLSIQNDDGSFPGGTWNPTSQNAPSVFNSGQILFGLCSLWQHEQEEKWKSAGEKCAKWLASIQDDDGAWRKYAYRNTLHTYKTRVAWPMAIAANHWGLNDVESAARKNIDLSLEKQTDNGWIRDASFDEGTPPVLHTFSYTVQGMLEAGILLDNQNYIAAAARSAAALANVQAANGSLPGEVKEDFSGCWYTCLTGISQTAIIWTRLAEIGNSDRDWAAAAKSALSYLERSQSKSFISGLRGAFSGSRPFFGPYMSFRYPNWAVKFYLDAVISAEVGMQENAWG